LPLFAPPGRKGLKQALQIASAVDDPQDQDFRLANLIKNQMLGKSRNQKSADIAEFGVLKTGDRPPREGGP
jgi:hypothetical protein